METHGTCKRVSNFYVSVYLSLRQDRGERFPLLACFIHSTSITCT